MRAFTEISPSTNYHRMAPDLDPVPGKTGLILNQQLKQLGARVWAHLTWGRWTAIGLFLAAFVAAQWAKHHW